MKQHQLANICATTLMPFDKFDTAPQTASDDLGLTTRKEGMCNRIENESFRELALTFHRSGDELATVLKGGNTQKSLQALNETMTFCVSCHAKYKQ